MKKKWHLGMVSLLALATLSSCVEGDPSLFDNSSKDDEIYAVYEAYKANGGTQSYDEWLASIKGEKGDKGDKGDTGAQGEKGDKGDKGDPGEDGQDGADGADGKDGQDGKDGTDGKDGSQIYTGSGAPSPSLGVTGDLYLDTDTGDLYTKGNSWIKAGNIKGKDGADGEDGTDGVNGKDGANGQDGKDGADGSDGADGEDGKSAYEIWLEAGNTGTEEDFLNSLKGSDGKDGATGAQGEKGDAGEAGKDGTNGKDGSSVLTGEGAPSDDFGSNGDSYIDTETFDYYVKSDGSWAKAGNLKGGQGEKGSTGATGAKGDKGDAGENGKDGKDGKDAVTYVPCIFNNWDGTKLYEFYFEKGNSAVYGGATPMKEDTIVNGHTAHWTFVGWDKTLENITEPTIFTAQYESFVNVTFKNYDGTELETKNMSFGEIPTYMGETPTKADTISGSTTIKWTFKGWDKAFAPVYEDTVYTAVYDSPDATKCKCTFVNEDGSELEVFYCTAGEDVAYDGETPTKAETNCDDVIKRYVFKGWDKSLTNIQSDTVFTARFAESVYYVCRFLDDDGQELKQVIVADRGKAIFGSAPYKEPEVNGDNVTEYTFDSWDQDTSNISAPMIFTAKYTSKTYAGYVVTFNDANDQKITTAAVAKGGTVSYPTSMLENAVDACYSYDSANVTMFAGWNGNFENVTETRTIQAKVKTLSRYQNGEYPQSKVTDTSLIAKLNDLKTADCQGYFVYQGEKYQKGAVFYFDDSDTWRKVEPVKWRYLRDVSNGIVEFMSDKILSTRQWNSALFDSDDGIHANNYANSDIRTWLNEDFLKQAFYYNDSLVQTVTVENGASTTSDAANKYACEDTTDKIYLPSCKDVTNELYGFSNDDDRVVDSIGGSLPSWWTRSPSPDNDCNVTAVSSIGSLLDIADINFGGVRPCLQLSVA